MNILQNIAQALEDQRQTEAAAFVRRFAIQAGDLCAQLGQPGAIQAAAAALQNAGMPAAADLALRIGAAALGACQAIIPTNGNYIAANAGANEPLYGNFVANGANYGAGGCAGGSCGVKPGAPGCGCGCGGKNGGCVQGGGGCYPSNIPQPKPPTAPVPVQVCPMSPDQVPACVDVGRWNCQAADLDLAPCDIARIQREQKLLTVTEATLAGPLAAGDQIAMIFAGVGVSHNLCITMLEVESRLAGVDTPITIGQFTLQGERIAVAPEGNYVHVWDWADPQRPTYVNVTDSRCQCAELCVCVTSEGRARLVFELPVAVAAGTTLVVSVWGERKCWLTQCGPCPPCDQCGQDEVTAAEDAKAANTLYVLP